MPVIGSSFVFNCAMVHDGVIRRSEEEAVEVIKSGTSRAVVKEGGIFGRRGRRKSGSHIPQIRCPVCRN